MKVESQKKENVKSLNLIMITLLVNHHNLQASRIIQLTSLNMIVSHRMYFVITGIFQLTLMFLKLILLQYQQRMLQEHTMYLTLVVKFHLE